MYILQLLIFVVKMLKNYFLHFFGMKWINKTSILVK